MPAIVDDDREELVEVLDEHHELVEHEDQSWRDWEPPVAPRVGDRVVVRRFPGDRGSTVSGIVTRIGNRGTVHATCFMHGQSFPRVALHHEDDPRVRVQPHILQEEGDQGGVYRLAPSEMAVREVDESMQSHKRLVAALAADVEKLRREVSGLKQSQTKLGQKLDKS